MAYFRFYLQLLPRQLSEHMGPLGVAGGEPTRQEHVRASCMAARFWCSLGLLLIWRHVIAPAIAAYSAQQLRQVFLSNSFVSLFNAIAAPVLAVLAMAVPWGDVERVMDTPRTTTRFARSACRAATCSTTPSSATTRRCAARS